MVIAFQNKRSKSYQLGLSLIELMVALSLGLFISAASLQVFLTSRESHEVIQAQSSMPEGARFGIFFIASSTRLAGYINSGEMDNNVDNLFASSVINKFEVTKAGATADNPFVDSPWEAYAGFQVDAVVSGSDNATGSVGGQALKANTDILEIRYQGDPDGLLLDCEGKEIDKDQTSVAVTTFFISSDDQLFCQVNTYNGETGSLTTSGTPVALVSGIENMQIRYGLGDFAAGTEFRFLPVQYKNGTQMVTDDWRNVSIIEVGLLAVSENESLSKDAQTFDLLGETINTSDGKARQIFSQAITLRGNN